MTEKLILICVSVLVFLVFVFSSISYKNCKTEEEYLRLLSIKIDNINTILNNKNENIKIEELSCKIDQIKTLIEKKSLIPHKFSAMRVTVTKYNLTKDQCDDDPSRGCLGIKIADGDCALSRDLFSKLGVKFGEMIWVEGFGIYRVLDITNKKVKNTIDIYDPKEKGHFFRKDVLVVCIRN